MLSSFCPVFWPLLYSLATFVFDQDKNCVKIYEKKCPNLRKNGQMATFCPLFEEKMASKFERFLVKKG
jgi:hypothetical protein